MRACCLSAGCFGEISIHVGDDVLKELVDVLIVEIAWEVSSFTTMCVYEVPPVSVPRMHNCYFSQHESGASRSSITKVHV